MSMRLHRILRPAFRAAVLLLSGVAASARLGAAAPDFNRDVRPILAENCLNCHGFDDKTRKAGLRLDVGEDAYRGGRSGTPAVVPGRPDESELMRRVLTDDPDDLMPPPETGARLTAAQVDVLRLWLADGGEYKPHWAFLTPTRPELPAVPDPSWPRNGIDHFVAARLAEQGLSPRPEADRETLVRRVTLDLTGLPPTPEEIDAFLADGTPEAYERVVDRLLGSARYGERMALEWLDAARYADTHGYHIDSARDMTPWRDWVIAAFNRNQPFDQFTIEQLAGDLLPSPTRDQLVASGFNRNHMINYEGGAIPEEYHTAYIIDRINTTSTVWMGLTMACAQCHDHKYDPVTMRDFYGMYAIFNNVPENGLDGRNGNAVPVVQLATPEQEAERARLDAAVRGAEERLASPSADVDAGQAQWEASLAADAPPEWLPATVLAIRGRNGTQFDRLDDRSWRATGPAPDTEVYEVSLTSGLDRVTALRIEALADDSLPKGGPGRYANGNLVLTDASVRTGRGPVPIRAASADHSQPGHPAAQAIDDQPRTGWAILPEAGRPHHLVLELAEPVAGGEGSPPLTLRLAFESEFPAHQIGRLRVTVTGSDRPHGIPEAPPEIRDLARIPSADRTPDQADRLRRHYREKVSGPMRTLREELASARKARDAFVRSLPTSMVMAEMKQPRETFMLVRGQYDKKGEKVGPRLPEVLARTPSETPPDRLALARWLVSPGQPLTARVTVNRYWQMYFGDGLVKSAENFGTQGDWPTHPALLDWLATEFMRTGWDVKAMQKLIVMSATYRQSSRAPRELYEADPENRLLARGPRVRLAAEFLRDLSLAASGLLDQRIGGASVFPYQPAGLWEELMSREDNDAFTAQKYVQSHGADLYRRSMYTFIKRTSPHPQLTAFDAPDRQVCTVRRPRTNTPLQALALMNDVTHVEAARRLAENALRAGTTAAARIEYAFRRATGRRPLPAESDVLLELCLSQREVFRADPAAAARLVRAGEAPVDPALDPVELAAWTVVMNAILNLDETVTKG